MAIQQNSAVNTQKPCPRSLISQSNLLPMKSNENRQLFATVTSALGISAEEKPSVSSPIAIKLLYSNSPDGSIRCTWSKGEWLNRFHGLLSSLGWQNALPGRLVLYTDVPTATFLQMKWQQNKSIIFHNATYFH